MRCFLPLGPSAQTHWKWSDRQSTGTLHPEAAQIYPRYTNPQHRVWDLDSLDCSEKGDRTCRLRTLGNVTVEDHPGPEFKAFLSTLRTRLQTQSSVSQNRVKTEHPDGSSPTPSNFPSQTRHRRTKTTYSRSRFPEKSNLPLSGSWRFHGT